MVWIPKTTTLLDCAQLLSEQGNLADVKCEGFNTLDAMQNSESSGKLSVTHLSYDSRNIQPGTLFFCKGAHFLPEYLLEAVKTGAIAYVSEHDYSSFLENAGVSPLPVLLVHEIRAALADLASLFYRGLLDKLTLIGFTGTKGKTTVTYLLRAILDSWLKEQGKEGSAWLSSIENYDGVTLERSQLTTLDVLELYAHFKNAVESNREYLTMEVSSQALKYGRTRNLRFEVGGFLNIGEDHISDIEHPNHEDYFVSKLSIFKQSRIAVVNSESDQRERVFKAAEQCEKVLTFGFAEKESGKAPADSAEAAVSADKAEPTTGATVDADKADCMVSDISTTASGLSFLVQHKNWQERFTLPMAGRFNVENALAALTAALALGVPIEHIKQGLSHCEVSGRMQLITGPDDKLIIVDYAHNKLSFETLFDTVSIEYPSRPIVCVFGATGSKGRERRIDLPAVAVNYADMIYITEDDPGEEPLELINQQIAEVVREAGGTYVIIEDRSQAIAHAITDSPAGSVVLILGKGHETVMKRGREAIPVLSDKECVMKVLALPEP